MRNLSFKNSLTNVFKVGSWITNKMDFRERGYRILYSLSHETGLTPKEKHLLIIEIKRHHRWFVKEGKFRWLSFRVKRTGQEIIYSALVKIWKYRINQIVKRRWEIFIIYLLRKWFLFFLPVWIVLQVGTFSGSIIYIMRVHLSNNFNEIWLKRNN